MTARALIFLVASLLAPIASAQTLADLDWLVGCWRTAPASPEERQVDTMVWTAPMPAMLGYAYQVRRSAAPAAYQRRIEMSDGDLHMVFVASDGQPVQRLRLRGGDGPPDEHARFEDALGASWIDFRRDGRALIVGVPGSGVPVIEREYRRIRCEEALRP